MSAMLLKVLWIYGLAAAVSMLIAGVIKVMVKLLNLADRQPVATPAPPAAVPAPAVLPVPAEHVAAIAAAVHASIGAHRIVQIDDTRGGTGWRAEGRAAQHRKLAPQMRGSKR
ncbi:MAG TPA: hypothetical protein VK876_03260 [Rubrivivax sp.]|nr:hypothetical protein [Rubrivivax sp.]